MLALNKKRSRGGFFISNRPLDTSVEAIKSTQKLLILRERYDMKISISKTKTMAVCREPEVLEIDIKGTTLKQTKVFKYLGSLFTENGRLDREIGIFCQKANAVCYQLSPLLQHRNISVSTKVNCCDQSNFPLNAHLTWALTKPL